MVKRSWSDSQSSSGDVCVFMSSLRRHARFSVCVLKENVSIIYSYRDMTTHYELMVDSVNKWEMNRNDDSV